MRLSRCHIVLRSVLLRRRSNFQVAGGQPLALLILSLDIPILQLLMLFRTGGRWITFFRRHFFSV